MASRRDILESLGLSPPLVALACGELCHPAALAVCRPVRPELLAPRPDEGGPFVPLWESASGSDVFFEVAEARRGPEFWSAIYDLSEDDTAERDLLACSEQGLLFWLFYSFMEKEQEEGADWGLSSLAREMGFLFLDRLIAFRKACAARADYSDLERLREFVRVLPAGPQVEVPGEAERLLDEGEALLDGGEYAEALPQLQAAWGMLPEPKTEHELAVRLMAAVGDCYFHMREWGVCHEAMQHVLRCGAALDNPFIRLRLGQSLYELGNEREAANWLVPVYLAEGRAPFQGDDPKYLEFFREKLLPPEGGWPEGW